MIRLLQGILVLILIAPVAAAQQNLPSNPQATATAFTIGQLNKPHLLRLIELNEAAIRSAKAAHEAPARIAEFYENLGGLYADAALYLKSQDAMRRAIAYLKNGSQPELANEIGQLAVVDLELGNPRQAEHDELQTLRIRQAIGDPVTTALAWNELAGLYDEQQKFKQAVHFAERAYEVLGNRPDVSAGDNISVREAFGFALTGARDCARGIPILKEALAIAQSHHPEDSLQLGYAEYVLGFGYWHCSDQGNAAVWLERGTTRMKADFGWDQTIYLNAMRQYARFLRSTGQSEAATIAESVVNQANAVVDAQSLTGRTDGFLSSPGK
jgi:tetratricopeptide (TPR) repeat protein